MKVLALDLGGTRLKAAVVEDGALGPVHVEDSPDELSAETLRSVIEQVASALDARDARGLGVCVPGVVEDGVVVSLPGKLAGLEKVDVREAAQPATAGPVVVSNDAIAYAVGEAVAGAGAGCSKVAIITIGTGVGTAVITNGSPSETSIYGGFIPIGEREDGSPDSIGRADTIEAFCRAERITGGVFEDPPQTYEAFARGDEAARDAIASYRRDLVRALRALASAHAPEMIVLGGGPMTADNPITPGIEQDVNKHLFPSLHVRVGTAILGDGAALIGLAHLVEQTAGTR